LRVRKNQDLTPGGLSLDATLSSVLPYYRAETGSKITVQHLLTHTSGIPSSTGLPNFMRDVSRNPYGVREFVEKYCSGNLEFEPGSRFLYNNSGYFLLGAIIESVTNKPYAQVLRERVFDPLGMAASGYDFSAPILEKRAHGYESGPAGLRNADYLDMGLPYAAGSLYSTVEDLYIWDQALYGENVLPSKAKDRMFTPGLGNYGFGWVIQKRPTGFSTSCTAGRLLPRDVPSGRCSTTPFKSPACRPRWLGTGRSETRTHPRTT
jgi:CubicO group peptidase (beta-lactamase class C family)